MAHRRSHLNHVMLIDYPSPYTRHLKMPIPNLGYN
jgi:hypothetical protein